jgi:hypothetical protein
MMPFTFVIDATVGTDYIALHGRDNPRLRVRKANQGARGQAGEARPLPGVRAGHRDPHPAAKSRAGGSPR